MEGTINLDPDYQRGMPCVPMSHENCMLRDVTDVVWKEEKQIGLVDSIFRKYSFHDTSMRLC